VVSYSSDLISESIDFLLIRLILESCIDSGQRAISIISNFALVINCTFKEK